MKEWFRTVLNKRKKEQIVIWGLLVLLLVVVLWPSGTVEKKVSEDETAQTEPMVQQISQEEQMEQALEETLAQVKGVGKVQVALTLESTNRKIVEKDVPDSQNSETRTADGESSESISSSQEETTVYERDGDGSEVPYVISEEYPEIRGVLVVAQGGDQPVVVQEIQEAVMALFGVDAHKIKVMKMEEERSED